MIDPELLGWLAAGLTLLGSSRREMIPLRAVLMFSNVCWVIYGVLSGMCPLVMMHALLFPVHLARLVEQYRRSGDGRASSESADRGRSDRMLGPYPDEGRDRAGILLPAIVLSPAAADAVSAAPSGALLPTAPTEERL